MKIRNLKSRLTEALNLARGAALCSEHSFRHGAVLFRRGKVIKAGFNEDRPVRWALSSSMHYDNRKVCQHRMHAEISSMHNVRGHLSKGASIFVVRINAKGEYANSLPCSYCQKTMKRKGIKRCYFTTDKFNVGTMEF